jgi:hypothetical protein
VPDGDTADHVANDGRRLTRSGPMRLPTTGVFATSHRGFVHAGPDHLGQAIAVLVGLLGSS